MVTPSKEVLRDAIIRCDTQEDLLKFLNIYYDWIKGLYDKYFKVSTFRAAKLKLFNECPFDGQPMQTVCPNCNAQCKYEYTWFSLKYSFSCKCNYLHYHSTKFRSDWVINRFGSMPNLDTSKLIQLLRINKRLIVKSN